MGILAKRHGLLGIEFDRYVQKHPELLEKIPHNARVILLREGNEKFNKQRARIGKEQAVHDQPLLYVTIKNLAPARSRIEEISLATA